MNGCGPAHSLVLRWMPGAHSRVGDVAPFMLSRMEAKHSQGEGLVSVEGTSPARSVGPQYITPGCGFSQSCLLWLSSVWGWGTRTMLALSVSLAAWEPSWAAVETCKSPKAPGGRRMSAPGPGNHTGVSLRSNGFWVSWG